MGSLSIWHWIIVLVVVLLVFGTKKLRNIGKDLGEGIKGFKQGLKDGEDDKPAQLGSERRGEDAADRDGERSGDRGKDA